MKITTIGDALDDLGKPMLHLQDAGPVTDLVPLNMT